MPTDTEILIAFNKVLETGVETPKPRKRPKSSAETIEHYEVHTSSGTYYTDVRDQAIRWAKKNKQKRIQVISETRSILEIGA